MNKEILAPDLGSDEGFPVVEILANIGDTLDNDDPILLLESDKASMEVNATTAGILREIKFTIGETVNSNSVVAIIEASEENTTETVAKEQAPQATATTANNQKNEAKADIECEVLVLGSGPGGYSAAFRSADLGMDTVLVERYDTLGGVCLNVGCIPSKALLHTAHIMDEAKAIKAHGVTFSEAKIDLDKIRDHKDNVVKKLTQGIATMAKMRKVKIVTGIGEFIDGNTLKVTANDNSIKTISFAKAIIAAGSRVINLPFMPDDPRVIDSTGALQLNDIPKHMLVVGGGIIGLEMATVYSSLGAKISVVELSDGLMPGADADLIKPWLKNNKSRFEEILLQTKVTAAKATKAGIEVTFSGKSTASKTYDKVLMAVGRAPNGLLIGAENAGITVSERGFINVNNQMQTNIPHIFAIGDIVGQPMLAHKAVHEAHVAAEAAAGQKSFFDAKVIPSVAYTSPEVAFVGLTETQAKSDNIDYKVSIFPWAASGKAIANNAQDGFVKLLFDPKTDRILGGGIVGTNAGDLISEICLAIEMGADATDIGKTIHPHPTLSESIGMAAENLHGHCTDLPPKKK